LPIYPRYLVGREERNMATFAIVAPPGSRLHPRSGIGKRTVSGRSSQSSKPMTNERAFSFSSLLSRYFCEPAYEKFRGTNEGALNSRLYNEKAYVLSRGFILRALETPPGSLEDEIRGFYLSSPSYRSVETDDPMDQDQGEGEGLTGGQGGGQRRLEKVLKGSQDLVSLSQALQQPPQIQPIPMDQGQPPAGTTGPPPTLDEEAAVPMLTAGGILTLQRVLAKLSDIQRNHLQQ